MTDSGCIAFVVFVAAVLLANRLLLMPLPLPKMCKGAAAPALVAGLLAKGVAAANGVAAFDVVAAAAVGQPKLLSVDAVDVDAAAEVLPVAGDVAVGLGPPKLNVVELAKVLLPMLLLLLAFALAFMLLALPKVNSGVVLLLVGALLLLTVPMEPKMLLPAATGASIVAGVVVVDVVAADEPKKKLLVVLLLLLLLVLLLTTVAAVFAAPRLPKENVGAVEPDAKPDAVVTIADGDEKLDIDVADAVIVGV